MQTANKTFFHIETYVRGTITSPFTHGSYDHVQHQLHACNPTTQRDLAETADNIIEPICGQS